MTDREAEDIYLDNCIEVNELFTALSEMIYVTIYPDVGGYRYTEARRSFGKSLAKLRLIKKRK